MTKTTNPLGKQSPCLHLRDLEVNTFAKYYGDINAVCGKLKEKMGGVFSKTEIEALSQNTPDSWRDFNELLIAKKQKYDLVSCFEYDNDLSDQIKLWGGDVGEDQKRQIGKKISKYVYGVKRKNQAMPMAGLLVGVCVNSPIILTYDPGEDYGDWVVYYGDNQVDGIEIPNTVCDYEAKGGCLRLLTIIPKIPVLLPLYQPLNHFRFPDHNFDPYAAGISITVSENGKTEMPIFFFRSPSRDLESANRLSPFTVCFDRDGELLGITNDIGRLITSSKVSDWNEAAANFFKTIFTISELSILDFDQLIQCILGKAEPEACRNLYTRFPEIEEQIRHHYPVWAILKIQSRLENMKKMNLLWQVNQSTQKSGLPNPSPFQPILISYLLCNNLGFDKDTFPIYKKVLHSFINPVFSRHIPEEARYILDIMTNKEDEEKQFEMILSILFGEEDSLPFNSFRSEVSRSWGNAFHQVRTLYRNSTHALAIQILFSSPSGQLFKCFETKGHEYAQMLQCMPEQTDINKKATLHAISLARFWAPIQKNLPEGKDFSHVRAKGWVGKSFIVNTDWIA